DRLPRDAGRNCTVRRDANHQRHRRALDMIALDKYTLGNVGNIDRSPFGSLPTLFDGLLERLGSRLRCLVVLLVEQDELKLWRHRADSWRRGGDANLSLCLRSRLVGNDADR